MSQSNAPADGYATIVKALAADGLQPNMTDYEAMCASFDWRQIEAALQLPRANGVNQATICLDGHPPEVMARTALIWRSADGGREAYTFADLSRESNRFANVLTSLGIQKGDRVFVYLERIPEVFITLFGALKLGAVVGPLFSAFGPEAIKDRLEDSGAKLVVTSPSLKSRLDSVRADLPALESVVLVDRRKEYMHPLAEDEYSYEEAMARAGDHFSVVQTDPDDYSIIHYTSGTTGKPKGAVHRHLAVLAQNATAKYILDLRPETDIYWCTADPGWVTGTSYGMFGPWSLGVTQVVIEGGFSADNWYEVLQEEKVTVWYTAPTAIRMLMKAGDDVVTRYDLSSLRHLCSVGEPLNPEAVVWGQKVYSHVFHDTWWQTETGAMHICNYPCLAVKPGSMGRPFPGVTAAIIDEEGNPLPRGEEGHLALRPDAPSFFRTYWQRDELYQSRFRKGWYLTGDRAREDTDGYFWFIGRADDVINTAGHLVGPFEVESALIEHPAVAEAGVIGKPDEERMEIVKAFISLKEGYSESDALLKEIKDFVRTRLAAHAYPREIQVLPGLPKTRSGKIMRRLLKARELGLPEGDTSTLEE
ncbi:MAG: acetate--CoA ligase [Candidatus Melainabacteria bacterium]